MKYTYLFRSFCLLAVGFLWPFFSASAQFRNSNITWMATPLNSNKTVDGFYQSLPEGYTSSSARYPLIIYLHGDESVEEGYTEILKNGVPKLISTGGFPETFKVQGQTHSFIVIAPHYTIKSLGTDELGEAINNIIKRFRINQNRIYLTGMSRGSAYTWEYAGANPANAISLAAIVPVSNALQEPKKENAITIGDADLPVWATHNKEDKLVSASYTTSYVDWVNEQKPQPRAELTLFESTAHEGWTETYDPATKFKGRNIYEWMLQYSRSVEAPLPVTLTDYKAYQSASSEVTLLWSIADEAASGTFTIERSATRSNFIKTATLPVTESSSYLYRDENPLPGDNYYRLSQTDPDGTTTYFSILKVSIATTGQPALVLQPTVVTGQALLQLNHSEKEAVTLSVFNTSGLLVQLWTVQKESGNWQQSVSFSNLNSGSYIVQAQGKTFQETTRFIKK